MKNYHEKVMIKENIKKNKEEFKIEFPIEKEVNPKLHKIFSYILLFSVIIGILSLIYISMNSHLPEYQRMFPESWHIINPTESLWKDLKLSHYGIIITPFMFLGSVFILGLSGGGE